MKSCLDCGHFNPDRPEASHCDVNHLSDVRHWWVNAMDTTFMGEVIDCAKCPGFVQDPWNDAPPSPAHECDLCLGTGFVDEDECPECHGLGTYSFLA